MLNFQKTAVVVILSCCFLRTLEKVFISVRHNAQSTGYFANISFSLEKFIAFQTCLCDKTTQICSAQRQEDQQPFHVFRISSIHGAPADSSLSVFICENSVSPAALQCTRAPDNVAACQNQPGYHFFRIPNSAECSTTCFGLLWRYPGGSFLSNLADVESCDGCSNGTTTTTSTTPTTPPTTTLISTARTTESANTAIATTEDTESETPPTDSSDNQGLIIGVVVGFSILVIVIVILAVVVWRLRNKTRLSTHARSFSSDMPTSHSAISRGHHDMDTKENNGSSFEGSSYYNHGNINDKGLRLKAGKQLSGTEHIVGHTMTVRVSEPTISDAGYESIDYITGNDIAVPHTTEKATREQKYPDGSYANFIDNETSHIADVSSKNDKEKSDQGKYMYDVSTSVHNYDYAQSPYRNNELLVDKAQLHGREYYNTLTVTDNNETEEKTGHTESSF